jgi:L-rhamnose isomerase
MPPTDAERIARLEAQQQEGDRVHADIAKRLDKQEVALDQIRGDVAEIKLKLSGWRGFLGGAMFVLTSIGGLIGAALMSLWHTLTGTGGN